jgi:hypothetical protein
MEVPLPILHRCARRRKERGNVGGDNLTEFKAVVENVNSVDPGYAFRYPAQINVREFAVRMDALLELLDSTADALAATWDLQMGESALDTERNGGNGFNPTIQ